MSYFLPSFFQKRLLRYALSRLELVDTDALDLESLGIRWGQRSTFELRDIGLRLEKLSSVLRLPPSCKLTKATVSLIRVTIPADIYSSSIVVEVETVQVNLKLLSDETPLGGDSHETSGASGLFKSPIASDPRAPQPHSHDQSSEKARILPSTTDLAQSFLESEPKEEKAELEAAISSQSQYSQSSDGLSDDGEEELGIGVEDGMSLPSFVAGFFQGVANRLQLKIKDVTFKIDMDLPHDRTSNSSQDLTVDPITAVFTVQNISIDSVASSLEEGPELKAGKRFICLSQINLMILADAGVFSSYSHFTPPSLESLSTTHSTHSTHFVHSDLSHTPLRVSSPAPPSSSSDSCLAMSRGTILDQPSILEDTDPIPHLQDSIYTDDGKFSDAGSECEYGNGNYFDHTRPAPESKYNENPLDNSGYLDEAIRSHLADELENSTLSIAHSTDSMDEPSGDTPRPQSSTSLPDDHMFHSMENSTVSISSPSQHLETASVERQNESSDPDRDELETSVLDSAPHIQEPSGSEPSNPQRKHSEPDTVVEDLSKSRIFTHEEATSMYMSVMSSISAGSGSLPDMPGGWESPKYESTTRAAPSLAPTSSMGIDPLSTASEGTPKAKPVVEVEHDGRDTSDDLGSPLLPSTNQPGATVPEMQFQDLPDYTPKVAKRVLEIDELSLWLPSLDKQSTKAPDASIESHQRKEFDHMETSTTSCADSVAGDGPSSSKNRLSRQPWRASTSSQAPPPDVTSPEKVDTRASGLHDGTILARVSSITIEFDIACGCLLAKMGRRLVSTWNLNGGREESRSESSNTTALPLDLTLTSCSVRFLEHLPLHHFALDVTNHQDNSSAKEIILRVALSGINFKSLVRGDSSEFTFNVTKFTFGHASEDIISFDEGLKMRDSIRDDFHSKQGDISLSVVSTKQDTRVDLLTLPVHLAFNLERLDETLSWFGGLSTILEVGNSIASTSTIKGGKADASQRPRGVHFEVTPSKAPYLPVGSPGANPISWKINTRMKGFVMTLQGEQCSVKLKTTAIKIVSRSAGITVQIDKGKLTGPILNGDYNPETSAITNLLNIRAQFMFAPTEEDLDRLLLLLTPSKDKYDEDDDIMLDTLFRQRKQGAVLRLTVGNLKADFPHPEMLKPLSSLGNELARLSTVTKYLPQDDRPGILTLILVRECSCGVALGGGIGDIEITSAGMEAAHVGIPSLMAARVSSLAITRNDEEELVGEAVNSQDEINITALPMIMARFIADEMDPTVKIKLHNVRFEYNVPSIVAFLGLDNDMSAEDFAANLANSVVNLAELKSQVATSHRLTQSSMSSGSSRPSSPVPSKLSVILRDCLVGLNPRKSPARGVMVFTSAKFLGSLDKDDTLDASLEIQKASLMIINDARNVGTHVKSHQRTFSDIQSNQVQLLHGMGYVPVCYISSAAIVIKVMQLDNNREKSVDIEVRDDLLILETCADSTQTLITILNELAPPSPPNKALKYRTEVMPIDDMLSSFTGNAFDTDPISAGDNLSNLPTVDEDENESGLAEELEYVSDFYPMISGTGKHDVGMHISGAGNADDAPPGLAHGSRRLLESFHSEAHVTSSVSSLDFQDNHFARKSAVGGTAHRWDSTYNTYALTNDAKLRGSPLRVRVRDVHFIWNLFDGFDWQQTRDTISKAVKDVEAKASEKFARSGGRASPQIDSEEDVIGDFLFNSIYIGIPSNRNPQQLREDINAHIDDFASETGSFTTTTTMTDGTATTIKPPSKKNKKLRLSRSKRQKMTFELKGISADLVVFPPGSGETQSSLDIRVNDLEIFDHVPSSNWRKFATYMYDAGEKESGTGMVHLEILNVKPVAELAASEIVLKATILPLRLHVDQDALDFMTRFFEFKDDSAPVDTSPTDQPFLQRVEVNAVRVRLDFKPKRVDYGSLRSGRTTEFMNFFVLEEADMVLRHVIIYGVSGFEKLGVTLNDIWMPDIKANQLPGVLAGLAPIKSLVGVGSGFKDLVVIPMREYKKDGRVVRSIQKGALAFAKTTTNELVKLGAKLAIGTQTVLQGTEDFLTTPGGLAPQRAFATTDDDSADEEQQKQFSPYADQPVGVVQGLRGAYASLERDLLMARDAMVAVPGEVMDSGSAQGAAKALLKRAPTVILRPAIGASKALGQTLLGAGNSLDPTNRRRVDDKYKRH
ncbi:autophagy-like protein 2 [Blastomyces dermatitidis ATCC 18188]|uniref:Autophagy-related protein 2 n=1 Tax=Ajellomyces dermatitidis (strain ATCC 18188 / CBS 674.68) TaxID=653446 RepID=F2TQ69_AJEDA|nr:autophagy-like protein 2 [Blastomyces dermatitidis ATCC 18188]EQL32939.1 autophagy-like protein 2 [Blastomyces dermatitidis ATCC 26199]